MFKLSGNVSQVTILAPFSSTSHQSATSLHTTLGGTMPARYQRISESPFVTCWVRTLRALPSKQVADALREEKAVRENARRMVVDIHSRKIRSRRVEEEEGEMEDGQDTKNVVRDSAKDMISAPHIQATLFMHRTRTERIIRHA